MFLDDIVGPMSIEEHIGKVKGGYRLYSHKGKNLGTFPNKAAAEKHEREVQYFKHAGESVEEAKKERKTNDDLAQTSQNAGTRELINKARRSTPGARSEQDAITNYLNQQSDALAQAQDELEKQKTTNQQQTAQL